MFEAIIKNREMVINKYGVVIDVRDEGVYLSYTFSKDYTYEKVFINLDDLMRELEVKSVDEITPQNLIN